MTTNIESTVEHRLIGFGDFDELASSVRALLFGVLADLAWPIVTNYRSDLYHDAAWISEHVAGPCDFFFAADAFGTAIGVDPGPARQRSDPDRGGHEGAACWRVELVERDGCWYALTTRV